MNPVCPNCEDRLLVTRDFDIATRIEPSIVKTLRGVMISDEVFQEGRARYWYCKKCKTKWKKGAEVIRKKN